MSIRILVTEGKADDALESALVKLQNEPKRVQAMQQIGERLKRKPEIWNAPTVIWASKIVGAVGEFELASLPVELVSLIDRHYQVKNNLVGNQKDLASFKTFAELKNTVDPLFQGKRQMLAFQDAVRKDLQIDIDEKLDSIRLMQYALDNSKIYVGPSKAEDLSTSGEIVVQPYTKLASQLWGRPQECGVDPKVWKNFASWCTTQVDNPNLWTAYAPRGNLIYAFDTPKLMAMPATRADPDAGLACFAYKGGEADEWFDLLDNVLRDDEMLKNMDDWQRNAYVQTLQQHEKYQGKTAQTHPLYNVINGPVRANQQEIKVNIDEISKGFASLNAMSEQQMLRFLILCSRVPHDFTQIASTETQGSIDTLQKLAHIYMSTSVKSSDQNVNKINNLMRHCALKIASDAGLSGEGRGVLWDLLCAKFKTSFEPMELLTLDAYSMKPAFPRAVSLLPDETRRHLIQLLQHTIKTMPANKMQLFIEDDGTNSIEQGVLKQLIGA